MTCSYDFDEDTFLFPLAKSPSSVVCSGSGIHQYHSSGQCKQLLEYSVIFLFAEYAKSVKRVVQF